MLPLGSCSSTLTKSLFTISFFHNTVQLLILNCCQSTNFNTKQLRPKPTPSYLHRTGPDNWMLYSILVNDLFPGSTVSMETLRVTAQEQAMEKPGCL